jgi:hypothetical protein
MSTQHYGPRELKNLQVLIRIMQRFGLLSATVLVFPGLNGCDRGVLECEERN